MSTISFRIKQKVLRELNCAAAFLLFAGVCLCLCMVTLSGCAEHSSGFIFTQQDITISVYVTPNANNSSAVAVDVLMPLTDETQTAVASLSARQWFSGKEQFQRDYTSNQDYWVLHHEYVPGIVVSPIAINLKDQTKSIIIFADYQTEGVHRFHTTRGGNMVLTLGRYDFTVVVPNTKEPGTGNE
ncbi:hypothetical protein [Desulfovibrio sp. UCD-KL4C]|uniref:hypothetical protein n=1 Tax=Desulfovibrio sp. UCD-KL4C TaxID=2578120 RepID=UPI0025BE7BD5|nr:hypothetical protein [Desulfovibrio sp. UCD-KL4C]